MISFQHKFTFPLQRFPKAIHPFVLKKWPLRTVASLERDNLVVFYYLSTPEIWHDERMVFGENALLEGGNCICFNI
jgi:hypothetical protein